MLYLKALVCKALFREFSYYAAVCDNSIDISYFEWGLHDKVGAVAKTLQEEIDLIDAGDDIHTSYPPYDQPFDGILIGYGLCSNGVVGLSSKRYPLIIPRAHDCITLLLGSKERYASEHAKAGGTYWLSPGWAESSRMPGARDRQWLFEKLCEKHDKEAAATMVEMNDQWMDAYSRLAVVEWPEFADKKFSQATKALTAQSAADVGLNYQVLQGNSSLVKELLAGNWDNDKFLVVPPKATVQATYDENIIGY